MKKLINFCSGIVFPLLFLSFLPFTSLVAAQNKAGGHSTHWGYTGSVGPSEWYRLAKAYALCGSGKRQSPVDIWNETPAELYTLDFQYQSIPLQVLNNGHTLQANYYEPGGQQTVSIGGKSYPVKGQPTYNSTLMLGDVAYKLLQFHFHTPSEHARNGGRYAMEVHLVHKSADGNLAVVGVLLKQGKMNPTLGKILDHASDKINETKLVKGVTINAADLLPADRNVFHYSGSLTTPPCSENVNWFVMKSPVEVSDSQVKQFARIVGENARPIQSMYWRSMLTSE
jgi:carbonic anhydrase